MDLLTKKDLTSICTMPNWSNPNQMELKPFNLPRHNETHTRTRTAPERRPAPSSSTKHCSKMFQALWSMSSIENWLLGSPRGNVGKKGLGDTPKKDISYEGKYMWHMWQLHH